ncbi:EAL domain-containing protein [Bacillus sp. 2205SS5-2]|uniref:EAL domain-containing protein n=1 Tax=Bacillus sp. 2205SS5-2 TaxID=3109031 RepID=UPI0030069830
MFFLFLLLIAVIPFSIGITVLFMVERKKLAVTLFLFLCLATIWQIDVSVLYAYGLFSEAMICFLFRLFRIGSIMVTPTLFLIAYIIISEELPDILNSKWRYVMNKKNVVLLYLWGLLVYVIGWSSLGISSFELMEYEQSFHFYFPIYGELSWVFHTNLVLFSICILVSLILCSRMKQNIFHSFLFQFLIATAVGYGIGILNMFPETRLFPSAVAVLLFATSTLILSNRMHLEVVKEMNDQLDEQRCFLSTVIDLNPNYIYAKDEYGRYSLVNKSFAKLCGMEKEDLLGKSDLDILIDKQRAAETLRIDKEILAISKEVSIPEEKFIQPDGDAKWLQTSKIPIKSKESTLLLGVSTDITDRKLHEDRITYQANHDVLTGLPNRRMFNEDLKSVLQAASFEDKSAAIMFIDLDRFKYINDTLGHDFGDLLLIEVSRRLETFIKEELNNSKVYRIGGDEFTFINSDCDKQQVIQIANRILEQFDGGFLIHEQEFYITPSIGISVYPEDGDDAKTLMKNADTAMYYVKEREKNSFQLFTKEMNDHFYRKMLIEKELRMALEREEFELHYQPLVNMKAGEITGMEALIRWENAELGNVSPAEFIPVAEETGLIISIGEWVLKTACEQNDRWQKAGYHPLKVGVNISIRQLLDKTFVKKVASIIKEADLDPSYIDLEITESIAMHDPEMMIAKLHELKEIGLTLSMDDFGTGYSSLSYLKKYPLDTLKIDRSFIRGITSHDDNKAIVNSILSMAKHLHLKVTAEGVEDQDEYQYLLNVNCEFVQGYGISQPLSAENFERDILNQCPSKALNDWNA